MTALLALLLDKLKTLGPSLVRTLVPFLVALLGPKALEWFGIGADDLSAALTVAVGGVYYAVVRVAETYLPKAGLLLGWAKQPSYGLTA
jgi:hypothetical protein